MAWSALFKISPNQPKHSALERLCLCVRGWVGGWVRALGGNVSISLTTARVSLGVLDEQRQMKVRTERVERSHHIVSPDKKANGATLPPHWISVLNVIFFNVFFNDDYVPLDHVIYKYNSVFHMSCKAVRFFLLRNTYNYNYLKLYIFICATWTLPWVTVLDIIMCLSHTEYNIKYKIIFITFFWTFVHCLFNIS